MDTKDPRLNGDPDWINLKRYDYSLEELLRRYDGKEIPDRVIASALGIKEEEVAGLHERCVAKLKTYFKVE